MVSTSYDTPPPTSTNVAPPPIFITPPGFEMENPLSSGDDEEEQEEEKVPERPETPRRHGGLPRKFSQIPKDVRRMSLGTPGFPSEAERKSSADRRRKSIGYFGSPLHRRKMSIGRPDSPLRRPKSPADSLDSQVDPRYGFDGSLAVVVFMDGKQCVVVPETIEIHHNLQALMATIATSRPNPTTVSQIPNPQDGFTQPNQTTTTIGVGTCDEDGGDQTSSLSPFSKCCTFSPLFRQMLVTALVGVSGAALSSFFAYSAVALPQWTSTLATTTTTTTTTSSYASSSSSSNISLAPTQAKWFASVPLVVSLGVSGIVGLVVEVLGFRGSLALCIPIYLVSWIVIAVATHYWHLILARVLQGILAAVYCVVIAAYPSEISSSGTRGILIGVSEFMVQIGTLITYVLGCWLSPSGIAVTLCMVMVPQIIALLWLPESPLWLTRKHREGEAAMSLTYLRGPSNDIKEELYEVIYSVRTKNEMSKGFFQKLLVLMLPDYYRCLILAILVLIFKELTGQYVLLAYTVQIFQMADSSMDPYLCTVILGISRVIPCFISWLLIERFPRRYLLASCLAFTGLTMGTVGGVLAYFSDGEDVSLPPSFSWVPVAGLFLCILAYGTGIGTTSWTYVTELLPSDVRNIGMGIATAVWGFMQFMVSLTYQDLVTLLGVGGTFLFYAACSLVGVVFVLGFLPETRGRSFEEIQLMFKEQNIEGKENFEAGQQILVSEDSKECIKDTPL